MLSPRLVTNGWSEVNLFSVWQRAVVGADKDSQTRLFQDVGIVVVGIAHSPAADVSARILAATAVHKAVVAVRPFLEIVHLADL